jgi:uncharacterized membrane protein
MCRTGFLRIEVIIMAQALQEIGGDFMQRAGRASRVLDKEIFARVTEEQLSKGLGWFSIGLGLAELVTPKLVANIAGFPGKNTIITQMFGLREITSGLAILSSGKAPATGIWSRVVGDALDIGTLGIGLVSPGTNKAAVLFATANVLAVTALDILCAQRLSKRRGDITESGDIIVERSIFINRPPEDLYRYWHNFERLPSFMEHLLSVETIGDGRSRWTAKAPAGTTVTWEAEVLEDRPNEFISWRSLPGSVVANRGTVRFERAPAGRGTYMKVRIEYSSIGGVLGAGVARLFREEPLPQLKDDLRRFKQIIEIGEIVRSDGSPRGNGQIRQHPGQPATFTHSTR